MIYAELAGGLGNQMFIYAFARALGLRCGEPVTLLDRQDWRDGAPAHTVCALDALNISPDVKIIADAGFAPSACTLPPMATPPPAAATPAIFSRGGTSRVSATLRILPLL